MNIEPTTTSYALSPLQAGMFFQSLYSEKTGVDVEQVLCSFKNIVPAVLQQAWQEVWQACEILRTGFEWLGLDEPVQRIHNDIPLIWKHLDWTGHQGDIKERLDVFLRQDRLESFSLDKPPLMRVTLIEVGAGKFWLVWSFHHILIDGRSFPLVFRQMAEAYEAISLGQPVSLARLRPYKDYISWLERQDWEPAKAYWAGLLKGVQNPTPIGIARSQPPIPAGEYDYGLLTTYLPQELGPKLKALAKQHSLTLNTLLQGAWAILLSRYSGETDVVFGTIRTGRHSALDGQGADEMPGLLINTLPVRVQIDLQAPALQIIKDLRVRALELRESPLYEHFSLAEIQKLGELKSGSRLFDTILAYENFELTENFKAQHPMLADWTFEILAHVGYGLVITATDGQHRFRTSLEYSRKMFDEGIARRLLAHLHTLLESIAEDPNCPVGRINLLPAEEKEQILKTWNQTRVEYPGDLCIQNLFESQVEKNPGAVALAFENQSITYDQLNQRANQLAHYLQKQGIGPGVLVGICVERSFEMFIGILAILKAGGAYVPLNPTFPPDRLAALIEDTRAPLVLTQNSLFSLLPPNTPRICLDTEKHLFTPEKTTNPKNLVQPSDLVYIVYTSGSTGKAKGVMISHANLVNAYYGWESAYGLLEKPTVHLQMANFSFDVFAGDWTRALCSGGKLVICPHIALLDPPILYDLIRREGVDCAEFVPAVFRNLQLYLEEQGKNLDFMRVLVVASDSWYVGEALQILKLCGPHTRLINSYGVTEATIDSTYFECNRLRLDENFTKGFVPNALVPIGKPFPNIHTYILDAWMQPVAIGIVGELYLGGAGVATGYLNRPELNHERFVVDVFHPDGSAHLYKTGDLARYLPDGNIEFLGREDHQVKIRGFRIELGEIESVLEQHPAIRQVVVLTRVDTTGQKHLVAYFTSNETEDQSTILRDYLKQKLPDYMIPSAFVQMEHFPLNASGKINRRALPEPVLHTLSQTVVVPASTPLEHSLIEIWSGVLNTKNIGITDNFFDLGGHSLLATRLFARIRVGLGLELPLRILFEAPTISELAQRIENLQWAARQARDFTQTPGEDIEEITI